jgi:hypothetical protein
MAVIEWVNSVDLNQLATSMPGSTLFMFLLTLSSMDTPLLQRRTV